MKIAVVGGGITGSVVASELSRNGVEVVLFDQGRRGPGGRASHRSVVAKKKNSNVVDSKSGAHQNNDEEFEVLPDDEIDESAFQFDHGCQFFRADSPPMKELVGKWIEKGWVAPWKARFGCLPENSLQTADSSEDKIEKKPSCGDFFGVPSCPLDNNSDDDGENDVYIGVGGMHLLPRKILRESYSQNNAIVHRGTRVSGVASRTIDTQKQAVWDVTTTVGVAAFHDTKESIATAELEEAKKEEGSDDTASSETSTRIVVHSGFDAVVFTDISSSSESWHRASAGIPPSFAAKLPPKLRLPLFSCMIALKTPIRDKVPFDAFVTSKASPLWFAAVSDSKPGFPKSGGGAAECWTLVSTPSFAVDEIRETTMRDPATGAFRPQENEYLNSIPGPVLQKAFFDLVRPYLEGGDDPPQTVYLQAQRWGSGLPIDPIMVAPGDAHEICGTRYASRVKGGSLVYDSSPPKETQKQNFVADDAIGLYYGGDFCSHLNPGFEAAALSGLDLANHILSSSPEKGSR